MPMLALDTDAHSVADIAYVEIALAHAVKAGATPDRVINCWSLDRLLEWTDLAWSKPSGA